MAHLGYIAQYNVDLGGRNFRKRGIDFVLMWAYICFQPKLFMCLTVPGIVLCVEDGDPSFRNAQVDFCGVKKTVNLAYTPEVVPGDFVLVHAGFATSKVEPDEAAQIFEDLRSIGALDDSDRGFPNA